MHIHCFPGRSAVKNSPANEEMRVRSLAWEDLLEKEMTTHSSILTWKILWTEEPDRLQSMVSRRTGISQYTRYGLVIKQQQQSDSLLSFIIFNKFCVCICIKSELIIFTKNF